MDKATKILISVLAAFLGIVTTALAGVLGSGIGRTDFCLLPFTASMAVGILLYLMRDFSFARNLYRSWMITGAFFTGSSIALAAGAAYSAAQRGTSSGNVREAAAVSLVFVCCSLIGGTVVFSSVPKKIEPC